MFNPEDQAEQMTQSSPSGGQVGRTDVLEARLCYSYSVCRITGKPLLPEPLSSHT